MTPPTQSPRLSSWQLLELDSGRDEGQVQRSTSLAQWAGQLQSLHTQIVTKLAV